MIPQSIAQRAIARVGAAILDDEESRFESWYAYTRYLFAEPAQKEALFAAFLNQVCAFACCADVGSTSCIQMHPAYRDQSWEESFFGRGSVFKEECGQQYICSLLIHLSPIL